MRKPFSLWPDGLAGRVGVVLAIAIAAQFITASLLIGRDERDIHEQDFGRRIAEQLLVAERVVTGTPGAEREAISSTLSNRHLNFRLVQSDGAPVANGSSGAVLNVRAAILAWEPTFGQRELRLREIANGSIGRRDLVGALEIEPDRWLVFETHEPISDFGLIMLSVVRMAVAAAIVLATAWLLVETLNRPLRRLSDSARLIGTRERMPFDESGPKELRRVSRALNEMQNRIEGLIEQRTRALAAVGHDLRTPLFRLRLRTASLADPAEREAARRDCATMERMLQELLDFYDRGESEPRAPSDVASLCEAIADDRADIGENVAYRGPKTCRVEVRHGDLTRAITNLVDNAVRHAGSALIELECDGEEIRIAVVDDGPGIPETEMDRLRLPFERLDRSRSSDDGGIGLGLSIVERAAKDHGGRLQLETRQPHGLIATLVLPRNQAER